jgi:hypothetical protein
MVAGFARFSFLYGRICAYNAVVCCVCDFDWGDGW